jgi:hypothetical protein
MSVHVLLHTGLLLCLILNLGGCFTFKGDPLWDPPTLSKEGCPDIEGEYKNMIKDIEHGGYIDLSYHFFDPYRTIEGETLPVSKVWIIPPGPPSADDLEMEELSAKLRNIDPRDTTNEKWALQDRLEELRKKNFDPPPL